MTIQEVAVLIKELQKVFDIVRLVDVSRNVQYSHDEKGDFTPGKYQCYAFWNKDARCQNCVAAKAFSKKSRMTKYEFIDNDIYYVVAKYLEVEGTSYVLEIISKVTDEVLFGALGRSNIVQKIQGYNDKIYKDSLTGALNRQYYEEYLPVLKRAEALAMLDADNFKSINDTYGHHAGDLVLQAIVKCLISNVRSSDLVIRYGGDEFLLVFNNITTENFEAKLEELRIKVGNIVIDEFPKIHITISIGGCFSENKNEGSIKTADEMLYKAKKTKNTVCVTSI